MSILQGIKRGQVWDVQFSPQIGKEIAQKHPAVVMSIDKVGRLPLHIVVPITTGKPYFTTFYWMIPLYANSDNGLDHDCFADAFQTKSVSEQRFLKYRGQLQSTELDEIATVIAYTIGHKSATLDP